jgi:cell division protein FtsX
MHDLDIRLERLAAEATRDAVPPEPAVVARRGRRRRRRQLVGSALVVAAVVAAGLVLPDRLALGPGPGPPAAAPPTDVAGAASLGGYWFGKADASVFLDEGITDGQRRAVRERIEALEVVDRVYHESRRDALARIRELYRTKAQVIEKAFKEGGLAVAPESFRVRLRAPEDFAKLARALCPTAPEKAVNHLPCMAGVEVVIQDQVLLKPVLVPKPLAASSDVTVLLPAGAGAAERAAVRARLAAIDGVAEVTYMTPEEAYRHLPEKLRRDGRDPEKVTPLYSPASMPVVFHVALDRPARAAEFHQALCGSRTTGKCAGGLVVLEHPRRPG